MTTTPVDMEKSAGLRFAESHHHPGGHSHTHHARERLQHFLHPNGRRIHVVNSPTDEAMLRHRLRHENSHGTGSGSGSDGDDDQDFDIYISGSPEHLEALRAAHIHHSDRREQLRAEHEEMYQRFADVHYELDALSHELDRVTSHGVALSAHFDKFGYDAHIKTYDDDSEPASGATTPRSTSTSKSKEGKAEKGLGKPLKIFQVPVLRQYFYKGHLWRSAEAEEVQSFELFVDLLYVGIIAVNGDLAADEPTAYTLLKFIITFTLSWKIWNDMTLLVSWFETDDLLQRVSILLLMSMLFGYTTNITNAFDGTYPTLIGFYIAARMYINTFFLLVAITVPTIRNVLFCHIANSLGGVAYWIVSIHFPYPLRLIWVFMGILSDILGPVAWQYALAHPERIGGPKAKVWVEENFQFWPAVNIEHRTERINAFVTLVFGYSIVSMLYQSTQNGISSHYGKAVLGITQAFCFNWMYFEIDSSGLHVHAIRRHKFTAFMWVFNHLPFIMAFVLGSGALSRLVLAVDCGDSNIDALTEEYRLKAVKVVPQGIRWFYCAGYAVALAFMGLISITHVHKDISTARMKKRWRLCARWAICVVMLMLPLAGDRLNSLQLVGIMTVLVALSLGVEHWCATCAKQKLFSRQLPCKYTGRCKKKDLEAMVKRGEEMDLDRVGSGKDSGCVVAGLG